MSSAPKMGRKKKFGIGVSYCYGYQIKMVGYPPLEHYEASYEPSRNPAWVDPSLVTQLPNRLIWPDKDLETIRTCVQACYAMDAVTLASIKSIDPSRVFGFEGYLAWLQHRLSVVSSGNSTLALVPDGDQEVTKRDVLVTKRLTKQVTMEIHIVRTRSNDSWGQAIFRSGNSLLSKAWIDLVTGESTIFHEYPGRWLAAGSSPALVPKVLGKCRKAYQSTSAVQRSRLAQSLLASV